MAYNSSRQARRRRKRMRRLLQAVIPVAVALILIGIIALVALNTGLFDEFGYSSKKADLYQYFMISDSEKDTAASVVRDGEVIGEKMTIKDGRLYIPYETVRDKYNENFYWEDFSKRLLYTTGEGVYAAKCDEDHYSLGDNGIQAGYTICYMNGEVLMLCMDYVRIFTNMEYELYGGVKDEPYRVTIKTEWGTEKVCDVTEDDVAIRTAADKEGDILKEVRKGSAVRMLEEEDDKWVKVMSEDLITGYMEKKHLSDPYDRQETPVTDALPINVTPVADYSQPLVLAWHNVTGDSSMSSLKDNEKYLAYINTISPTWFSIADNEGTIESIADQAYVETCHAKGIKVWGLMTNVNYPEVSMKAVLSDPAIRSYMTEQLLGYASQYSLDGINIDLESIPTEDGPAYVQFVREFCLKAHERGLVVSVDNYVPKEYNIHYDRQEQGIFADYVIIMGYDEHTAASEEAGSVASIDFVLEGIEKTLEDVPKEKVINALPFYTRHWTVDENGSVTDVKSLPMSKGSETVSSAGAAAEWDAGTGQNYAEWTSGGSINKIWLEDGRSIQAKLEVMKSHEVGGVAVWQLAFGTEEAFTLIDEYYRPRTE